MNLEIKLRELSFIVVGIVISMLLSGLFSMYNQYIKQRSVSDWIRNNSDGIKIDSKSGKAKLLNNTSIPGTLRLSGVQNEADRDDIIKNISYKIVVLNCPFPIVSID